MVDASSRSTAPWSQRILERSPLSPFASGALVALGFLVVFLALELALGRFARYGVATYREDLRVAVVLCLLAGYLPAAWTYSVRSARRTFVELEASLRSTAGAASPRASELGVVGRYDATALRWAGLAGLAVLVPSIVFAEAGLAGLAAHSQMSLEAYAHRVLLLGIAWLGGRAVYATWVESRRFSRLGRERLAIDLLDLGSAAPLIRYGLRQSLVTIGSFSILALLFFDFEAAPHLVWFLLAATLGGLALSAIALLMPVRGARDAIAREKAREILRVNDEIRRARDGAAPDGAPRLADWIAYRGLIESVREWPVDAPTLRRFALYLAIPLGSWLGGALVERMVDALLG